MTNHSNKEPLVDLKKISESLIKLGKEIEVRLAEKQKLESEVSKKEIEIRKLESEVFQAKQRIMKLNFELSKLEAQMEEIGGKEAKQKFDLAK